MNSRALNMNSRALKSNKLTVRTCQKIAKKKKIKLQKTHSNWDKLKQRCLAEILWPAECRQPGHRGRSDAARAVATRSRQRRWHRAEAGRADDRHEQLQSR